MHFCNGEARIEPAAVAEKKGAKVHGSLWQFEEALFAFVATIFALIADSDRGP